MEGFGPNFSGRKLIFFLFVLNKACANSLNIFFLNKWRANDNKPLHPFPTQKIRPIKILNPLISPTSEISPLKSPMLGSWVWWAHSIQSKSNQSMIYKITSPWIQGIYYINIATPNHTDFIWSISQWYENDVFYHILQTHNNFTIHS